MMATDLNGRVESHPIFAKPCVKGSQALLKRVDIVAVAIR